MAGDQYIINQKVGELLQGNTSRYQPQQGYPEPTHQDATGWLGTPVYGAITFRLANGDTNAVTLTEALCRVTDNAEIVRTTPAGETNKRKGSVFELMAFTDYGINISGIISTNHNARMPLDELQQLRYRIKAGALLYVESRLFNVFGITQMVIEKCEFEEPQGEINILRFTAQGYSYQPDELEINDGVINPTDTEE